MCVNLETFGCNIGEVFVLKVVPIITFNPKKKNVGSQTDFTHYGAGDVFLYIFLVA